jgi:HlyD family type I secretion membrane fusion protein
MVDVAVDHQENLRDWRRPAVAGYAIILLTFVVLGGWAALAKLDSAIVAPGVVTVESSRKVIAHLEGGIVRQIFVREGQHVDEGALLYRLDDTQSQAGADLARNQLFANLALEARLIAERDRKYEVEFPPQLTNATGNSVAHEAIDDQRKQFAERRASLNVQMSVLQSRIVQFKRELEGLAAERTSVSSQLSFVDNELTDLRELFEKKLVPKSRVMILERERSRLEGLIGRSDADSAKANNGIAEARLQMEQLQKKYAEEVNAALLDVRQKLADIRERSRVSADVLKRTEIRAPRSGEVQNVKATTVGGVIRPGEPLLELIPDGDELMINAQIQPGDIDAVSAREDAEVRFAAFHGKILPIIMGHIVAVSHDRLVDDATRQPYFLARIKVNQGQLPLSIKDRITAGMPVEVVLPTGERTIFDYLVRPLRNRVRKALREQ